jgi:hypothetical protein
MAAAANTSKLFTFPIGEEEIEITVRKLVDEGEISMRAANPSENNGLGMIDPEDMTGPYNKIRVAGFLKKVLDKHKPDYNYNDNRKYEESDWKAYTNIVKEITHFIEKTDPKYVSKKNVSNKNYTSNYYESNNNNNFNSDPEPGYWTNSNNNSNNESGIAGQRRSREYNNNNNNNSVNSSTYQRHTAKRPRRGGSRRHRVHRRHTRRARHSRRRS